MLSRDELIENVWTRNVVTSHVVTQSISELRKSLKDGDDVSLEYIATVPKRGYKLTVPVIWCTEEGGTRPADGGADAFAIGRRSRAAGCRCAAGRAHLHRRSRRASFRADRCQRAVSA